jgi:hypothetical protein
VAQRILAAASFQVFAGSRHSVVETTSKKNLKLAQKTILKTLSIFKIYHWGISALHGSSNHCDSNYRVKPISPNDEF